MIGATNTLRGAARTLAAASLAGLVATGCAVSPSPELYVLDFPAAPELAGIEDGIALGVGPIEFPQYLDRPQIVTRGGPLRVGVSEGHQWAEPLKDGITRVLVVDLAKRLDTNRVHALPQRVRTRLDWRVEIDLGRLDGVPGAEAVLAARWSLFLGDDKEPVLTRVTVLREPASGEGFEGLVAAHVRLLSGLAGEIAREIGSR